MNKAIKSPAVSIIGLGHGFLTLKSIDPWINYLQESLLRAAEVYGIRISDKLPLNNQSRRQYTISNGEIIVGVGLLNDYTMHIHDMTAPIPRVLLNRIPDPELNITSVSIDHYSGAFKATQALLGLGHRNICIDCAGDKSQPGLQRMQGFFDACKKVGIEINGRFILDSPPGDESELKRIKQLLQSLDRPTGLILGNCSWIEKLLELCGSIDLKIPRDLSVIMFDDAIEFRTPDLEISVVLQPLEQMAGEGMRLIKQLIDGGNDFHQNILLKPDLLIRDSIAVAPIIRM